MIRRRRKKRDEFKSDFIPINISTYMWMECTSPSFNGDSSSLLLFYFVHFRWHSDLFAYNTVDHYDVYFCSFCLQLPVTLCACLHDKIAQEEGEGGNTLIRLLKKNMNLWRVFSDEHFFSSIAFAGLMYLFHSLILIFHLSLFLALKNFHLNE